MSKGYLKDLINYNVMKAVSSMNMIAPLTSNGVLTNDDAKAAIKQVFPIDRDYTSLLNCISRNIIDRKDGWVRETMLEWAKNDIDGLILAVRHEIFTAEEVKPLSYIHATKALLAAIAVEKPTNANHVITNLRINSCLTDKDIEVLCLSVQIFPGELKETTI